MSLLLLALTASVSTPQPTLHLVSNAPLTHTLFVMILLVPPVPPTASASRAPALASATAAIASPAAAAVCLAASVQLAHTRSLRLVPRDTRTLRPRAAATGP